MFQQWGDGFAIGNEPNRVTSLRRRRYVLAGLLIAIGLLPDVLVRPRLATRRAQLSASLYFVGFVGGVVTVGVIGVTAGPLVVALLVEVVTLLSDDRVGISD